MEWPEKFLAAFAEGTLARLKAVMRDGEDQRAVIRAALDRELSRREREAKRKP